MNSQHDENLWSAYLDGELTASESLEVDGGLTDDGRARLAAEMRFERLVAERLSVAPPCPDALWEGAVARMRPPRAARRPFPVWRAGSLAAAFVVAFSFFLVLQTNNDAEFLAKAASINSLRDQAQVTTRDEVQALLRRHGITLRLRSLEEAGIDHHQGFLVGAVATEHNGEPVVQLLYGCCGNPAKVIVARRGGAAAGCIAKGVASGRVQACCATGDHVVAVVSPHPSAELLHVLH